MNLLRISVANRALAREAPAQTIYLIGSHGDSRLGGVYPVTPPTFPSGKAYQYVLASEVSNGYPLTAGITDDMVPFANPVNPQGGGAAVIPMQYAIAELLDPSSPYYLGDDAIVVYAGGGFNSASVAKPGHTLGPLPDTTTLYNKNKWQEAYAACQANWPSASIQTLGVVVDVTNDRGAATPAEIFAAQSGVLNGANSLRTATGFTSTPWCVVSMCPEATPGLADTAQRLATMKTPGTAVWCQLPTGVGQVHEGETDDPSELPGIETSGREYYARSIAVALGKVAAATPNFAITDNYEVEEGSGTTIPLSGDRKVYFTVHPDSVGLIELSGDLEFDSQILRPFGGAWPAFDAGTPANNTREYKLNYKTDDGLEGTITKHVVITEVVVEDWLFYDDFNRADVASGDGNLGVSSGKSGVGGGIPWVGKGGISSGQMQPSWTTGTSFTDPRAWIDAGTAWVEYSGKFTKGGDRPSLILVAGKETSPGTFGSFVMISDGGAIYQLNNGSFGGAGTFTAPSAGQHDFRVELRSDQTLKLYIDGSLVTTKTLGVDSPWTVASDQTLCGLGVEFYNAAVLFDDVGAKALA